MGQKHLNNGDVVVIDDVEQIRSVLRAIEIYYRNKFGGDNGDGEEASNLDYVRKREKFGDQLVNLRKRLGLGQKEFAKIYGLDYRTVQNWEQERRKPDAAARALIRAIQAEPGVLARVLVQADTSEKREKTKETEECD